MAADELECRRYFPPTITPYTSLQVCVYLMHLCMCTHMPEVDIVGLLLSLPSYLRLVFTFTYAHIMHMDGHTACVHMWRRSEDNL